MTICNGFHPTHQAQLEYAWGGKYGGANCTACSAGMAGESDTCGADLFTGAKIRAASNEPIPDPTSPGLNLSQVHASLFDLSHGAIDLDVRYGYPFDSYKVRLIDGDQAILQGARKALVDAGQGYGNDFSRGHAIATGSDSGVPWFDDPLTGRHPTTWATLEKFAGTLNIGDRLLGIGKAYAAFTRDITADYQVTIRPLAGQAVRRFVRFFVVNGVVQAHHELRATKGLQVKCTPPHNFPTAGGNRVSLVRLTKAGSSVDGWYVSSDWSERT
jgi:hypothetical protein